MTWNAPTAKTPQEVADEKLERDDEAYATMYQQVREEMQRECDFVSPKGVDVHNEVMKRLREKNLR